MIDHAAYSPTGATVCTQGVGSNSADMNGADGTPDLGGPLVYGALSEKAPFLGAPWFGVRTVGTFISSINGPSFDGPFPTDSLELH